MEFTARASGGILVFNLSGDVTSPHLDRAAPRLKEAMISAGSGRFLYNLAKVTSLDSAGIGMLVALYKAAVSQQRALAICSPKGNVKRAIDAAQIDRLIKVFDSQARALKGF